MSSNTNHHKRTLRDLAIIGDKVLPKSTFAECIALLAIYDANEPMTMSQLGASIPLSRAAVTSLADRLESVKLVQRVLDKGDRRRIHLVATKRGRLLLDEFITTPEGE